MGVVKKRNRVSDYRGIVIKKVIDICITTVLFTVKTRVITIDLSFLYWPILSQLRSPSVFEQ